MNDVIWYVTTLFTGVMTFMCLYFVRVSIIDRAAPRFSTTLFTGLSLLGFVAVARLLMERF